MTGTAVELAGEREPNLTCRQIGTPWINHEVLRAEKFDRLLKSLECLPSNSEPFCGGAALSIQIALLSTASAGAHIADASNPAPFVQFAAARI